MFMNSRWFTDPAANGPAAIRPIFTMVEQQAFQEILRFANNPANTEMEFLQCLDAAGTFVHSQSTGCKTAPLTPGMLAAMAAETGVRQWHNHPSQDSLSHHDWCCAGASENIEVLALNTNGSIFVGRIPLWDDRLDKLLPWLPRLASDLEFHIDKLAKERNLSINHVVSLSSLTGHILNIGLAKRMPVRYAFRLLGKDESTLSTAETLAIVTDGIAFAEEAIQDWLDERDQ